MGLMVSRKVGPRSELRTTNMCKMCWSGKRMQKNWSRALQDFGDDSGDRFIRPQNPVSVSCNSLRSRIGTIGQTRVSRGVAEFLSPRLLMPRWGATQ